MIKKAKKTLSLNTQMLLLIAIGIFVGLAALYGTHTLGMFLIDKYYMSSEAVTSRKLSVYNEFKEYVRQNNISSRDTASIAQWSIRQPDVTIYIYNEKTLKVMAGSWGADMGDKIKEKPDNSEIARLGTAYPLNFVDGQYQIFISETSQTQKQFLVNVVAITVACAMFVIIMMLYIRRITKLVISLARDAQRIGGGDLNKEVAVRGSGELEILSREMDNMRLSIVTQMQNEHRAWQANSDLITAISHDIRTPLTAMIGYLDLLGDGESRTEEQRRQFADAARGKAMELKELTDKLFQYFLVFNKAELPMELEPYDANILLGQLLGEAVVELRDMGYNVSEIPLKDECVISVDVLLLKRVIDNVFSNVKKYADKKRKIAVIADTESDCQLKIYVSNIKSATNARKESTKIGLQTCGEIMRQLGGTFEIHQDDNHFTAEISLPIVRRD